MDRILLSRVGALIPLLLCLLSKVFADTTLEGSDVIHRDVAVIGGGSAGVYAALRLRDHKQSVMVIEPQPLLGGHADTYITPQGYAQNMGVVVWGNTSIVRDYFARFDIPLVNTASLGSFAPTKTQYTDFSTGRKVDYTPPTQEQTGLAFERYTKQLLKYPSLDSSFNMTYPVAEDLLLPFGDFVRKYKAEAILPVTFSFNQGYAPLLNISTLYMLKYLNKVEVQSIATGFLTTVRHNTQELYNAARKELGQDALLNTRVSSLNRGPNGNLVHVNTPSGPKTISAKKILITAQPGSIDFGGLTSAETSLFDQFFYNGYYSVLLSHTSLPTDISFSGADPSAPYFIPPGSPGAYSVSTSAVTNLTSIYYGTAKPRPLHEIKTSVMNVVRRLQRANGYARTDPKIVAFSNHAPFNAMVSNEAIKDGFYKKLFALQGKDDTFYSGAAWDTQDSTYIWKFTEDYLLPKMLASLGSKQAELI